MNQRYKTYQNTRSYIISILGSSLLVATHSSAADYYWDTNSDTAGFGSASGTTWSSVAANNFWSTSPTGEALVTDYTTSTTDDLYFGTESLPLSGSVTIDGTVNANSIFNAAGNFSGTNPTINFSAEGSYTRANNNGSFPSGTTFTGLGTSLTWYPQRNLNISDVTHNAGAVILSSYPGSPFPYPGRTVMSAEENLGAPNTPLIFDGGTLRMASGFPYETLSALDAAHPITFTPDRDAGFEFLNNLYSAFTIDIPIDLGTGTFWPESSNGATITLTQPNVWGQINLVGATVEASALEQLGPVGSTIQVGSGTGDLSSGVLRITGTTLSNFNDRNFQTTDTKSFILEIVEAAHTFTLDRVLDMGTGGLTKNGDGTLVLTEANTYTGATSVNGGTLSLVGGSQASDITVSSGASLGLTIGSATTSTAAVDLTNGGVTISNPEVVDGETEYLLMTASTGFTFTDIETQLGTTVTGYELQLQNTGTELWLVPAASGSDYATWASGFAGFTDSSEDLDFDGGSLESGIEYIVGGDPTNGSDDAGKAPVFSTDETSMTFTFDRDQISIHPNSIVTIEVGTDLATWPDAYTVGADTAGSTAGVTVTKDTSPGFDTVTLTVAKAADTKKFARLTLLINP